MSDKKRKVLNRTLFILSMVLVLAVVLIPLIDKNFKQTLKPELTNFAVENPDQVTEIFMASKSNEKSYIKLVKDDKGVWMVNGQFPAEKSKVDMLLYEYLAKLKMKNPLPNAALDNALKSMAANAIKVEVYKGTHKDKVFYVGKNAIDDMGTIMMLENSSRPFVVHIPGFMGYPAAIFNLNPNKWKSLNLFQTSIVETKSVQMFYPSDAAGSFTIEKEEKALKIIPFVLEDMLPAANLNIPLLKQYTATFENLNYEAVYEGLAAKLADSVVHHSKPFVVITLTRTDGKVHELKIFKKPVAGDSPQTDNYGNPATYDLDRFYAVLDGNESDILSVQSFVFKNIFKRYPDFFSQAS
ncbi:MAG: hypothetical protein GC180_05860 [Bacteroidetes bacterium]|nr:hypothetical protein [Bacteroidota bacterium]